MVSLRSLQPYITVIPVGVEIQQGHWASTGRVKSEQGCSSHVFLFET